MQGRNGEELTKCYNKCKSLFIPKENGEFAGSFSGLLSETYRARKLADILNEMYFSQNGKLVQFVEMVMADVRQGDALPSLSR